MMTVNLKTNEATPWTTRTCHQDSRFLISKCAARKKGQREDTSPPACSRGLEGDRGGAFLASRSRKLGSIEEQKITRKLGRMDPGLAREALGTGDPRRPLGEAWASGTWHFSSASDPRWVQRAALWDSVGGTRRV